MALRLRTAGAPAQGAQIGMASPLVNGGARPAEGTERPHGHSTGMTANYPHKPFEEPVTLGIEGETITLASVNEAYDMLVSDEPPLARDARYRDLCALMLKVFDGHRSTSEARRELVALAGDRGLLR